VLSVPITQPAMTRQRAAERKATASLIPVIISCLTWRPPGADAAFAGSEKREQARSIVIVRCAFYGVEIEGG
jgi:hypothetical protein